MGPIDRSHDERWLHLAGERLKFRCYQCNQLLASAPGKAGSIVSCPRCKADLVVPAAESLVSSQTEATPADRQSGAVASTLKPQKASSAAAYPDDTAAAAIPADLADLRPEDLRVEAEFFESLTRGPQSANASQPASPAAWEPATPYQAPDPGPVAPPTDRPFPEIVLSAAPPGRAEVRSPTPWLAADSGPPARPNLEVPPIEIEPVSILPSGAKQIRSAHEVVLPASVVLAWSVFGMIGIATSFLAGLMVGHYFWKL